MTEGPQIYTFGSSHGGLLGPTRGDLSAGIAIGSFELRFAVLTSLSGAPPSLEPA
jgi:hypothetical protein